MLMIELPIRATNELNNNVTLKRKLTTSELYTYLNRFYHLHPLGTSKENFT